MRTRFRLVVLASWLMVSLGCGSDGAVDPVDELFGASTAGELLDDAGASAPIITAETGPQTQITFSVLSLASGSVWVCRVAGSQYEIVRALLQDSMLNPGRYAFTWDTLDDAGAPVPAGQYAVFVVLKVSEQEQQVERVDVSVQRQAGQ